MSVKITASSREFSRVVMDTDSVPDGNNNSYTAQVRVGTTVQEAVTVVDPATTQLDAVFITNPVGDNIRVTVGEWIAGTGNCSVRIIACQNEGENTNPYGTGVNC